MVSNGSNYFNLIYGRETDQTYELCCAVGPHSVVNFSAGGLLRSDVRVGHRQGLALLQVQRQAEEGLGAVNDRGSKKSSYWVGLGRIPKICESESILYNKISIIFHDSLAENGIKELIFDSQESELT